MGLRLALKLPAGVHCWVSSSYARRRVVFSFLLGTAASRRTTLNRPPPGGGAETHHGGKTTLPGETGTLHHPPATSAHSTWAMQSFNLRLEDEAVDLRLCVDDA